MELIFKFYDGLGKMDYVWNIEEKLTYQSRNLKLTSVTPFYLFFFKKILRLLSFSYLTLSWRMSLPYKNQSVDSQTKSMDWFLYDWDLRLDRVKASSLDFSYLILKF